MIDHSFQLAARHFNELFQPETVERHWSKIVEIIASHRIIASKSPSERLNHDNRS